MTSKTGGSFESLGLSKWLIDACQEMGIRKPTEIQRSCIPQILKGSDVLGRAQTGSGKTAAFALPILEKLSRDPFGIFAIVLTPTRELAFQIAEQFRAFGLTMGLKEVVAVGGMDMMYQGQALSARPHIVIATPGRLADHVKSGTPMHLEHLQFLVLDEADRLFEDCFQPDMQTILEALPPKEDRQTLMFSATLTKAMADAQAVTMNEEMLFEAGVEDETKHAVVESLDQRYIFIPQAVKECYLVYIINQLHASQPNASIIVFTSTCRGCEIISQLLIEMEIDCVSLHSRKNQARRLAALGKFKSGASRVLVATDIASRGLDIPTVQLVLNFDVPRLTEDYVHRVGRTARAGRGGLAVTLVSQYDIKIFQSIETYVEKKMDAYEVKESKVLDLLKKVSAAMKMAKMRLEDFTLTSQQTATGYHREKIERAKKQKLEREESKHAHSKAKNEASSGSSDSSSKPKSKKGTPAQSQAKRQREDQSPKSKKSATSQKGKTKKARA